MNIPLFPLNTVLFPGGPLPLRVFEPRYLDMVSQSMKTDSPIGVVLIKSGNEVGPTPDIYNIGTMAKISYWHERNDGLLGITLTGIQRFKIIGSQENASKLLSADVEKIDNLAPYDIDDQNDHLISILEKILDQLDPPFKTIARKLDDIEWVSARLLELLPTDLDDKQRLLESNSVSDRLAKIESVLKTSNH